MVNFVSRLFQKKGGVIITNDDLLKYALDNDMIDLSYVQEKIEMSKREELLKKHPYKIWQGKDGYWHTYIPDKDGRSPRKRREKSDLESLIIDYWKQKSENPTVEEVFIEWNDRRLVLKKISEATHLRNTQVFRRHFCEVGKVKIRELDQESIGDFLEEQIFELQLTAKAFSNLKTITRGFLKRAKKRKLISFNVEEMFSEMDLSDVDFKKVIKEDCDEVFDEDEMPRMIEYLEQNLDTQNLCILLMFLTGIRVGEAVSLKHSDFQDNTFKIRRTETRYRESSGCYTCAIKDFPKSEAGIRTAIIPEDYAWVAKKVKQLNPFGEYVFTKDGVRISAQSVRMRLKRICKKLEIKNKSPHKIRKTYGTILLDNHIDNKLVMAQMGHTDILCTERHYHRNRRSIQKKTEILSNIPEFKV